MTRQRPATPPAPRAAADGARQMPLSLPLTSGRVYINATQYFEGISQAAWEYTIGGYQPILAYLKARRGRQLSEGEIVHVCRMVDVIERTMAIMGEIDAAIPEWPLP